MVRYLPFLVVLSACQSPIITGEGGIPELFWDGENVEMLVVESSEPAIVWNIAPSDPPEDRCVNSLDGSQGVVYNQLPEGYQTIDTSQPGDANGFPPMENVPETLEDGEYVLALQRCVDASSTGRSFQNTATRFEIVDGEAFMLDE